MLIFQDDADEVTWQTYKGQLTEKQEKTREKIIKRLEKVITYYELLFFLAIPNVEFMF